MRTISRNIKCKCLLLVIAFAPIMLFWWKEPKTIALKTNYLIMNSHLPWNSKFTTKLGADTITCQWQKIDTDKAEGILDITDQKTWEIIPKSREQQKLIGNATGVNPGHSTPKPKKLIVKIPSTLSRKVWNENSSSKDLVQRLQKVKMSYVKKNMYNVTFPDRSTRWKRNNDELLCMFKNVTMDLLKSANFSTQDPNWTMYLPTEQLHGTLWNFNRCAVVSSAGAMKSSRLGSEIDGHDAVLRFNAAPIHGYQDDVGMKTTIRLMNSQVVTTTKYRFLYERFFRAGTLIMWDPAPYHASLQEWYKKPEYKFSDSYVKYRLKNPEQPFFVLNPSVLWRLWDVIQANTFEDIQPNPPSSGLIGIILMMSLCNEVNIYEYLPSRRKTDICHYYERFHDSACVMGAFHPLTFEKNLVKRLNQGTDENIYFLGKATLPGFSKFKCQLQ